MLCVQMKVYENTFLRYSIGSRTETWMKEKCMVRQEEGGGINVLKVQLLLHYPSLVVVSSWICLCMDLCC